MRQPGRVPAPSGRARRPRRRSPPTGGFSGYVPVPEIAPRSSIVVVLGPMTAEREPWVDVPDWPADVVFYQVFPDRFARSGRVPAPGAFEPWDAPPTHAGFKGGDLYGLVDRLDDLADLGISALYLNPVFTAASNHRYNAADYLEVDPLLGGDAALRVAARRGPRPRHPGHPRRRLQPLRSRLLPVPARDRVGARHRRTATGSTSTRTSSRAGAGSIRTRRATPRAITSGPATARGGTTPSLPKLRVEHPPAREYLMGVAEHWLRFGIDGWRLDVPADIEDPTFWPEFRRRVRAVNPDAYLVGEIWTRVARVARRRPVRRADELPARAGDPRVRERRPARPGGDRRPGRLPGRAPRRLDGPGVRRPSSPTCSGCTTRRSTGVQFNLIGSHDAPRPRTVLAGDLGALRLATLLPLVLPGTPSIYYGDELGMEGGPDPDCRRGYPTAPDEDALAMRAFVRAAIHARREHRALRRGTVAVAAASGQAIALAREADGERALVAINSGREPARLDVDPGADRRLARVELPGIAAGRAWRGRLDRAAGAGSARPRLTAQVRRGAPRGLGQPPWVAASRGPADPAPLGRLRRRDRRRLAGGLAAGRYIFST